MVLDINLHKNILIKILKDVYSDTELSPFLGFKGGTAAFLFYDLPRFSVDLDFDLLDQQKEDLVFNKVEEILSSYGEVKDAHKKRFTLFFLLSYQQGERNLKVEISRRNFGSQYQVKTYLGIPMKVMVKKDMAAHKMVAMYQRAGKTNRDIFDVWYFLDNDWPLNEKIIEKRTDLTFKEFLQKSISALEEVSEQQILSGMGEFLEEEQKDWARQDLKEETLFLLKLKLKNMEEK